MALNNKMIIAYAILLILLAAAFAYTLTLDLANVIKLPLLVAEILVALSVANGIRKNKS